MNALYFLGKKTTTSLLQIYLKTIDLSQIQWQRSNKLSKVTVSLFQEKMSNKQTASNSIGDDGHKLGGGHIYIYIYMYKLQKMRFTKKCKNTHVDMHFVKTNGTSYNSHRSVFTDYLRTCTHHSAMQCRVATNHSTVHPSLVIEDVGKISLNSCAVICNYLGTHCAVMCR